MPWKLTMIAAKLNLIDKACLDIGDTIVSDQALKQPLTSDLQKHLRMIQEDIKNEQVTRGRLEYAPNWVMDEALRTEYFDNWGPHTTLIPEKRVGKSENIIHSHVGYKIKSHEDGSLSMKARICPHGNRDKEKDKNAKIAPIPSLT